MAGLNDPVASGLVASLARPGGNVTGNTQTSPDLVGKQLALLKEAMPGLRRVAILVLPADPSHAAILAQVRPAAQALGIEAVPFEFVETQDFVAQLERVRAAEVQAFFPLTSQYFIFRSDQQLDFQIRTRIGRMSSTAPPHHGMIAYGASEIALWRQAADYVDAILKGTRAADLPVQQATVFDLIVNLKTARAMGLTIPSSILAQATIVVE
jgi:putative ABC transport system substrate-binding protein